MIRSTQETLFRLDNLNKEQQRISYQMSTGNKLQQGSDDASLYAREVYIDDKIQVYEGLKSQIEKTNAQNNTADTTLKEIKDLLTYVKAEVMKALNDTTGADAKAVIAANLEGVKENLFDFSNEKVEGEYLYSGSDAQVQAFVKNADGSISYNGDTVLRKVAVEDASYKERGTTGFEIFMYTSSSALKNSPLEFNADERIIDQDANEWKFIDHNSSGTINDDRLYKIDEEGNPSSEFLIVTAPTSATSTKAYEIVVPNEDGSRFEAKTSTFDAMDKIINSLKEVDSDGNSISSELAKANLGETLDEITLAFDAANMGHAKLGGRNRVFELSLDRVNTKLTQFNILSQEVGAADLSKVAVEAKALELTYTALYSTINKMNELSLVNFIR